MAGAEMQRDTLATACDPLHPRPNPQPNVSLLLQCRALPLPQPYSLQDHRVGAILPLDAVGSEVLGQTGLSPITIPVMMVAGSHDTTAPLTLEQFRLFNWLKTRDRYLGLIKGKSHIRNWDKLMASLQLQLKIMPTLPTPDPSVSDSYIKALSVAFFNVYVAHRLQSSVYLHASYGQFLSQSPYQLSLLDSSLGTLGSAQAYTPSLAEY
ncbi:MAG: hypothetical protein F6K09_23100 [Merismopedia sp. SIO2A8]|nr:hypothetical protein [Merismopedia sp. SIO2A8]